MDRKCDINGRSMILVLCDNDDLDKNNDHTLFSIAMLRCHYLIKMFYALHVTHMLVYASLLLPPK